MPDKSERARLEAILGPVQFIEKLEKMNADRWSGEVRKHDGPMYTKLG
jgi:hypothetical protein